MIELLQEILLQMEILDKTTQIIILKTIFFTKFLEVIK